MKVIAAANSNTCAVFSTDVAPPLKACDFKDPPYVVVEESSRERERVLGS